MSTLQKKREAEAKVQQALIDQRITERRLAKERGEDSLASTVSSLVVDTTACKSDPNAARHLIEEEAQRRQTEARLEAKRAAKTMRASTADNGATT